MEPLGAGPYPVILDCDPGHDDALAILLALTRPEIDLRAITTVAGNATLEATTRNALSILTLAGRTDVPVAAGARQPLRLPLETAAMVHGIGGLDGAELPEPRTGPVAAGAVGLTTQVIERAEQPVTIIATGPLTNVAMLLTARPDLRDRIASIRLMGGAIGPGNRTASAEFNIWADPHAAAQVFDSGLAVTMIGLDVTHKTVVPVAHTDGWADLGATGRIFADLFRFFARFHAQRYAWDGSPIHDAVVVAHLAEPGLVSTRPYRVDVETESPLTRGRTVVDLEGLRGLPPNVEVGIDVDATRFVHLIDEALASLP